MERAVLIPSRCRWLAAFALIAFLFAQSAALLHELSHAANGPDQQLPAGERTSLCKECVSHAPLLAMAGGASVVFFLALQFAGTLRPRRFDAPTLRAARTGFLARAPPR
ncbi:MAG: hypothetical protein KA760_03490 [Steroidobacteraceae bacterium]|jgi:hypothetical protein|nr:hypothetical protein [Steroidobacteraceae bacterium]MBP9129096.1 hypothetical protein [Steroidobacteraceae bacterium]